MGYLFVVIVLLAGAVKGFFGKKTGGYATTTQSSLLLSLIRMFFCVGLSFIVVLFTGDISFIIPQPQMLFVFAVSGISTALFVTSWLLAVRKNAYMMLDVFLMISALVPMISANILFNEEISIRQWIGFGVLLIAVAIMCAYNKAEKAGFNATSLILLIICAISSGVADTSQKVFAASFSETPVSVFNFYTYAFSCVALVVFFLFICRKEKTDIKKTDIRRVIIYIIIMSLALVLHSYFKTLAAFYLDSVKLYPLNQAGALILSSLMARFLFKEKMPPTAILGIVLAFGALLLINL